VTNGQLHLARPMPLNGYRDLRRWAQGWLNQYPVTAVDPDGVILALVELVSNSMRHGAGVVDVDLSGDANQVLLSVGDTSELLPNLRTAHEQGDGGRGLALVAALSSNWGVLRRPQGGKTVWCEFPPARPTFS
jgi:signal transduction histidine kinase